MRLPKHAPAVFCNMCNCYVAIEEAVPYVDQYNQPIMIQGHTQYRNWCKMHWSLRRKSNPPGHPAFYRPLDPRTRTKDRRHLQSLGWTEDEQLRTPIDPTDPSPTPEPPARPPDIFHLIERAKQDPELLRGIVDAANQQPEPPPKPQGTAFLDHIRSHIPPRTVPLFPKIFSYPSPDVDVIDALIPVAIIVWDATVVDRLEKKNFSTNQIAHFLKAQGYDLPRIAAATDKGIPYLSKLLSAPSPDLRNMHEVVYGLEEPPPPTREPEPELKQDGKPTLAIADFLKTLHNE